MTLDWLGINTFKFHANFTGDCNGGHEQQKIVHDSIDESMESFQFTKYLFFFNVRQFLSAIPNT